MNDIDFTSYVRNAHCLIFPPSSRKYNLLPILNVKWPIHSNRYWLTPLEETTFREQSDSRILPHFCFGINVHTIKVNLEFTTFPNLSFVVKDHHLSLHHENSVLGNTEWTWTRQGHGTWHITKNIVSMFSRTMLDFSN